MKVVVQQIKCEGFINLIPFVKGKPILKYGLTIYPSCYKEIPYHTSEIKKRTSFMLGD